LSRQCGASNFGEEADVETERGLAAVSWRAGVTRVYVFIVVSMNLWQIYTKLTQFQLENKYYCGFLLFCTCANVK